MITKEEIVRRLRATGHDEITVDLDTYKDTHTKCRFIDSEFGEWWAYPDNVIKKKSRHPKRGHAAGGKKQSHTIEYVKEKLKSIFGDIITIDESTYINGGQKARFLDKEYGEFWCGVMEMIGGYIKGGHPLRARQLISKGRLNDVEEMKSKIKEVWGDEIELLQYNGYNIKSIFKHKIHGEWMASFYNVINGHNHPIAGSKKQKETMLFRYGVEKPSQSPIFADKIARSQSKIVIVKHWETNEEVICTASYEYAIVNHFNDNKIDFKSQIPFDIDIEDNIKRVYFIDFYLPNKDLYVEVKGFFRDMGQKKWNKFHAMYPNSEVWFLEDIKRITGKTEYRITKDFKLAIEAQKQNENISQDHSRV